MKKYRVTGWSVGDWGRAVDARTLKEARQWATEYRAAFSPETGAAVRISTAGKTIFTWRGDGRKWYRAVPGAGEVAYEAH